MYRIILSFVLQPTLEPALRHYPGGLENPHKSQPATLTLHHVRDGLYHGIIVFRFDYDTNIRNLYLYHTSAKPAKSAKDDG